MEDFKMLKKGSVITVRHLRSGDILHYLIVEDKNDEMLKLVNLGSSNIMSGFTTANPEKVREYIEERLKCKILEISSY
jgi:hypothetical protein